MEDLVGFCGRYSGHGQLCLIVDQINALDPELSGDDNVSNEQFMKNKDTGTGDRKIAMLGGMTSVRGLLCDSM